MERATIQVKDGRGDCYGELEFADQSGRSSILWTKAGSASGPAVSLLEDQSYEIAFHPVKGAEPLRPKFAAPFLPSRLAHVATVGTLPSSRFVGTTVLHFYDAQGGRRSSISVDVRSRKLEYLTEFYGMLEELSGIAVELVTTLKSSFTTRLRIDSYATPASVQQRLLFLKSICDRQEIFSAFKRIELLPHATLVSRTRMRSISKGGSSSRELAFSLASSRERLTVPVAHPLAASVKHSRTYFWCRQL